jgi:hypothetical protein
VTFVGRNVWQVALASLLIALFVGSVLHGTRPEDLIDMFL